MADEKDTQKETDDKPDDGMSDAAKEFVVRTVNAAMATRFDKTMPKLIDGALSKALAPFSERFEAASKLADEKPEKGQKGEKPNELKAYEAKLAELTGKLDEERRARDDEKATRLRDEERSKAAAVLREAGLSEPKVKAALAMLHTEEKRIARAEDGAVIFKIPRKGYEEAVDLASGLREWLKTDEGKEFAPPRPAGGAGTKGGSPPEGKNGKPSKEDMLAILSNQLLSGMER